MLKLPGCLIASVQVRGAAGSRGTCVSGQHIHFSVKSVEVTPASGGGFGQGEIKKCFHLFSLSPTDSLGCSFSFMLVHSELGLLPSAGAKSRYKSASSSTTSAYFGSDVHPC